MLLGIMSKLKQWTLETEKTTSNGLKYQDVLQKIIPFTTISLHSCHQHHFDTLSTNGKGTEMALLYRSYL